MQAAWNGSLALSGERKIQWYWGFMPLLGIIEREFQREKPFAWIKIAASLPLGGKSACLCRLLTAGGAQLRIAAYDRECTESDVAAALSRGDCQVFYCSSPSEGQYEKCLDEALGFRPHLIMDSGGALLCRLLNGGYELFENIIGGWETTAPDLDLVCGRDISFPMVNITSSRCISLLHQPWQDARGSWERFLSLTGLSLSGREVVVAGYGYRGRSMALWARELGAKVTVTEHDPVRALQALAEGCGVMTMENAAPMGDIFVAAAGRKNLISSEHMEKMKEDAILWDLMPAVRQIDIEWLRSAAVSVSSGGDRNRVRSFRLSEGKRLFLLLFLEEPFPGEEYPREYGEVSIALQALTARHLIARRGELSSGLISMPEELDRKAAALKLASMGVEMGESTVETRDLSGEKKHFDTEE